MSKTHPLSFIVQAALKHNASDIHILGNGEVFFRANKNLLPFETLSQEFLKEILNSLIEPNENVKQKDLSVRLPEASLRVHCYLERSLWALSIRILPREIPSFADLGLPEVLKDIFSQKDGLILVSGATGSGKSSSIAAALEYINQYFQKHIICIEDPIEYLHTNDKSFFSYREVSKDTENFESAILSSLREDPDIVFIGELRNLESIKSALLCAQTGHLVVASIHAQDAASTIARIIYSSPDRAEMAMELAFCLRGIISQELISIDGGLRAIFEVLIATPAIKNLIREQKSHQIPAQITMGKEFGMISFEHSRSLLKQANNNR